MIPASGDATLLRFYEGENEINILIDGGNKKDDCINYLEKLKISSIDLLIVSHLDEDHIRGLRRIADEIEIRELWITDISPLIQPAIEVESIYMMKCLLETSMIVDSQDLRNGNKQAVYDGHQKQIGPFHLQVLSPPKSLHNYLRQPDAIKKILKSNKGKTIKGYVRRLWEDMVEREGRDQVERREEIVSEIIKRFEVKIPQMEEIEGIIEKDDYDPTYWQKIDKYYESARSLFNDISIVVNITYNYHGITKRFLFPGDLTNWSIVLAKYPQQIRNLILKVPHHGSDIYCDPDDYSIVLFETSFDRDFLRRLPPPLHDLWDERQYIIQKKMRGHIPPPYLTPFYFPLGYLPTRWNNKDIYAWLAPERALIYPLKGHKLPILNIRNQVINASMATSCIFRQGRVNTNTHELSNSCINCYNCTERPIPIVFEWKDTGEC